jgi:hypothetical protein
MLTVTRKDCPMNIPQHDDKPPKGCFHKHVPEWGQGTFPKPYYDLPRPRKRPRSSRVTQNMIDEVMKRLGYKP